MRQSSSLRLYIKTSERKLIYLKQTAFYRQRQQYASLCR